jgi:urease accessory protein UreH
MENAYDGLSDAAGGAMGGGGLWWDFGAADACKAAIASAHTQKEFVMETGKADTPN